MAATLEFTEQPRCSSAQWGLPPAFVQSLPFGSFLALDHANLVLMSRGRVNEPHHIYPNEISKILADLKAAGINVVSVRTMDINRDAVSCVEPYRSFWLRTPSATKSLVTFKNGDAMNVDLPHTCAWALLLG